MSSQIPAARSESSTSFHTAGSSPPSSPRSDASVETVKETATEARVAADVEEDNDPGIEASMDPVQRLEHELQRVQDDQKVLERDLVEAGRQIDALRNQVEEAEERAVHDPTKTKEYQNLLVLFRESQARRRELEDQLNRAEERERELKRQLRQAQEDLNDNKDRRARLDNELNAAKAERDLHAQRATALQYQLNDTRRQHGVQAEFLARLAAELNHRNQERERYEGLIAQLQEQRQQRQLEEANPIRNRKTVEVQKRNGQLYKVRRSI